MVKGAIIMKIVVKRVPKAFAGILKLIFGF